MQKSVIIIGIIVIGAIATYAIFGSPNQKYAESQDLNIKWHTDLNWALDEAKKTNKLIFIDFYATWCTPCQQLDKNTFSNEQVKNKLSNYIPIRMDVDKNPGMVSKYMVHGYPTMVFLKPDGSEIKRIAGYVNPDKLLGQL